MYADDTIILANFAESLQKALNDLLDYCVQWKLEVNADKSKIMLFSKRICKSKHQFKYNGKAIEVVNDFKYLGVTFKYNGSFQICKSQLKEQALRAVFALLSKGRKLQLPIDIMTDLFNNV